MAPTICAYLQQLDIRVATVDIVVLSSDNGLLVCEKPQTAG